MTASKYDDILEQCLGMMETGSSLEECLALFPGYSERLRGQLEAARSLMDERPRVRPDASATASGRAGLLAAVARRREAATTPGQGLVAGLLASVRTFFTGTARRNPAVLARALPAAVALLVLGGATWGVSAATGNTHPGDWFTANSSSEQRVELRGIITAIDSDSLTIETSSGAETAMLTERTEVEDGVSGSELTLADLAVGDLVEVHALVGQDGTLVALEVELDGSDDTDEGLADDQDDDSQEGADPGYVDDSEQGDDSPDATDVDDAQHEADSSSADDADDAEPDHDSSSAPDLDDAEPDHDSSSAPALDDAERDHDSPSTDVVDDAEHEDSEHDD